MAYKQNPQILVPSPFCNPMLLSISHSSHRGHNDLFLVYSKSILLSKAVCSLNLEASSCCADGRLLILHFSLNFTSSEKPLSKKPFFPPTNLSLLSHDGHFLLTYNYLTYCLSIPPQQKC